MCVDLILGGILVHFLCMQPYTDFGNTYACDFIIWTVYTYMYIRTYIHTHVCMQGIP